MSSTDDRLTTDTPSPGTTGPGTAARRARQQQQRQQQQERQRAASKRRRVPSSGPASGAASSDTSGHDESGADLATTAAGRRELDPDRLAAMEEERDFLLRSLDDLEREHDAGDVDDADYEALRDDYTARAAAVLRAIESRHVTMRARRSSRSPGRRWLAIVGVLVAGLVAGIVVAQSSGRREQGQTLTGDIRTTTREQLFQAQQLFSQGKLLEAIKVYDQVLANQPANAEALTYKGWLLRLTANQSTDEADRKVLLGRAVALLDQAVQADPGYADARVFRASILNALGRPQEALADLDTLQPGAVPDMLSGLVGQLRTSIQANIQASNPAGSQAGPGSGSPGTPGSTPPGTAASAPPTATR